MSNGFGHGHMYPGHVGRMPSIKPREGNPAVNRRTCCNVGKAAQPPHDLRSAERSWLRARAFRASPLEHVVGSTTATTHAQAPQDRPRLPPHSARYRQDGDTRRGAATSRNKPGIACPARHGRSPDIHRASRMYSMPFHSQAYTPTGLPRTAGMRTSGSRFPVRLSYA
jgi:hypothetical protein